MSLGKALSLIDEGHKLDPTHLPDGTPYELHYAEKCTRYLFRLQAQPGELLQIAIRAQHYKRWEVPRSTYPMTRPGYLSWRTFLKKRQGELAALVCLEAGYGKDDADRVASLIRKENLKQDSETQVLEDVACLVFLDDQFAAFNEGHDEGKIVRIVQKTWKKMSERGRKVALEEVEMTGDCRRVVGLALAG